MALQQKNLNLLITFDVLLQECNVTRAATRLHITQSAASKQLNQLREMLQDPILVRTPQGMQATEVAKSHHATVKDILLTSDLLFSSHQEFNPKTFRKDLHIGMPDAISDFMLPKLMKMLRVNAPLLRLHIHDIQADSLKSALENKVIDIAITYGFNLPSSSKTCLLFKDRPVVMARKNHPLMKYKNPSIKRYLEHEHLVLIYQDTAELSGDVFLQKHGYSPRKIALTVRSAMMCLPILAESDYLFSINEQFAELYAHRFGLTYRPLPTMVPSTPIHLVWQSLLDKAPWHQWLRELIKTV